MTSVDEKIFVFTLEFVEQSSSKSLPARNLRWYHSPCRCWWLCDPFFPRNREIFPRSPAICSKLQTRLADRSMCNAISRSTIQRDSCHFFPFFFFFSLFSLFAPSFSLSFSTPCDTTRNVEHTYHMKIRLRIWQAFRLATKFLFRACIEHSSFKFMNFLKNLVIVQNGESVKYTLEDMTDHPF